MILESTPIVVGLLWYLLVYVTHRYSSLNGVMRKERIVRLSRLGLSDLLGESGKHPEIVNEDTPGA